MRSKGEEVTVSQRGGAFTTGKVHQNCGVEHWLNGNIEPLTLRQLFSLVVDMTTGCGDSPQTAVEGQDVGREKADVGAS